MLDLLVIGGGAAGFYGAIHAARQREGLGVCILEQQKEFLGKVRISGGGRCNVTHRPLEPAELAAHYPRGSKELIGPFYQHASADVIAFFEGLGVPLKTESDGRVFPVSDRSESVVAALLGEAGRLGIRMLARHRVTGLGRAEDGSWAVSTTAGNFYSRCLLVCPGGSKRVWEMLRNLGHRIIPPIPSLFTFRVEDPRIEGLQGISSEAKLEVLPPEPGAEPHPDVHYKRALRAGGLQAEGPLLFTHWGLSGPAVLRLSAWGARYLAGTGYQFRLRINWLPEYHKAGVPQLLQQVRQADPSKSVSGSKAVDLPGRLWKRLVAGAGIDAKARWAELSHQALRNLAEQLCSFEVQVNGKSTFKDEFVTAGGVSLREVDFRSFESKKLPGLYLAGEVLDVDAITGGFNFQNAWTGGYLAGLAIAAACGDQPSSK